MSSFTPSALTERTLKQFVDRLTKLRSGQPAPKQWPPKRAAIQEEIAHILGFSSWHQAIHAVRPTSEAELTVAPTAPAVETTVVDPHQAYAYPNEPAHWNGPHLADFLLWAANLGASDVVFVFNEQIAIELYGKQRRVTKRALSAAEVLAILDHMVGEGGRPPDQMYLDFAYVALGSSLQQRFRVNAATIHRGSHSGWEITMHAVAQKPPQLDLLKAPNDLVSAMRSCRQGMIVITGGTGSGKSTLLSSVVRDVLDTQTGKKVITYEAPIEFEYSAIDTPNTVTQTDVSSLAGGFAAGIRGGMQRRPTHIVVGEARDQETLAEAYNASMMGHCVLTTLNATGCANALWRMISCFPRANQRSRAIDVLSSVHAVVCMRLVPDTKGKRVALFEHLVFDDALTDRLIDESLDDLMGTINAVLEERGTDFASDARRKHKAGLISTATLAACVKGQQQRRR